MQTQADPMGRHSAVPAQVPTQAGNVALAQVGSGSKLVEVELLVAVELVVEVLVVPARLVEVVVAPTMVVDVVQPAMGATSWLPPGRATAPGPGRSPALSTVLLPDAGMQKTLTSVAACVAPSPMHTPAGEPFSVIVRAGP